MGGLFSFAGRSGRLVYWGITLLSTILLAGIILAIPESKIESGKIGMAALTAAFFAIIISIWLNVAVTVRRFHDRGKSGLWYLALFVPLIGLWFVIELAFFGGIDEGNDYGAA